MKSKPSDWLAFSPPRMTATEYYLRYRAGCCRGRFPHGEGDFLRVEGTENRPELCLFLPAGVTAACVFYPAPAPDSLLLDADLRHALLTQYLEEEGLTVLESAYTLAQTSLMPMEEVVPESGFTDWFYQVPTNLGYVALCVQSDSTGPECALPVRPVREHLPDWSIRGQCRVGWCHLPLTLLRGLEKGDVVLVTQPQQWLTLAGRGIGQWNFDWQGVVMESMNRSEQWMGEYSARLPEEGVEPFNLKDIELTLEIVLGYAMLPLTQAVTLEAGDFVPLARGGVMATQLRLDNQTIASGELVEIDGRLGIILNHIYSQPGEQK